MEPGFEWVPFFEELATKISAFQQNQSALIDVLKNAGVKSGLADEFPEGTSIPLTEIDPFSFFALINKYSSSPERAARLASIKEQLELTTDAPLAFKGVPSSDPRKSWLFPFKFERGGNDIKTLWSLFAETRAGNVTDTTLQQALKIKQVGKAKITEAMFWVSPRKMFPVDSQTRPFLEKIGLPSDFSTASDYLAICKDVVQTTGKETYVLSSDAYDLNKMKEQKSLPPPPPDKHDAEETGSQLPSNLILYGPAGTGKTYATKQLAVDICDRKPRGERKHILQRYEELRQQNRIEFVSFHQSFSYEDFVEGLRPVLYDDNERGDVEYECRPGIFKRICAAAEAALTSESDVAVGFDLGDRRLFKMSLGDTNRPDQAYVYPECIQHGYVLLGYGKGLDFTGCKTVAEITEKLREAVPDIEPTDYNITSVYYLISEIQVGDLVLISDGNLKFRAIGEVTGEYEYLERDGKDNYCQKRTVRWLRHYEHSQPIDLIFEKRLSQMTVYLMDQGSIKRPALEAVLVPQKTLAGPENYVLVIDEINRANISKVFGELISLLEPDKRLGATEQLVVRLPYSGKTFGVPKNLYVIGTMNTADRSIALLDTALRRRFEFREIEPNYRLLVGAGGGQILDRSGDPVDLRYMLMAINERIEFLLGRDQRIGHAYLIEVRTLTDMNRRFTQQIVPLLKEYFYEDWAGIARVLAVPKSATSAFVTKVSVSVADLFGSAAVDEFGHVDDRDQYVLAAAFTGEMYRGLYHDRESVFQKRLDAA